MSKMLSILVKFCSHDMSVYMYVSLRFMILFQYLLDRCFCRVYNNKRNRGEILWIDIKCGKYLVAIGCGLWNMDEREREGVCDVIKRVLLSQHKWIYHKYKMRSKVISMLPLDCSYATKCHDHGG